MRCPMVSMEEIAHLRNAHMLPTTMNQRSPRLCLTAGPLAIPFHGHVEAKHSAQEEGKPHCGSCLRFDVVFIPHAQTNTLSKLKMTRKLCKFSRKKQRSKLSCSLLSCVYRNCINMAKLSSNKKMLIQVCMCVSVFQFSMKVAMKTLGSYILPLFQLQANYKYGNNFHIQVTRNGPTQQAP